MNNIVPANRKSLLRKRASRLAAAQALYSEALIEKKTLPMLLANQVLQSWADSKLNDTEDLPNDIQPEAALLNKLIETAQQESSVIESAIESIILPNWKKARMSLPLLALLRTFAAEALAFPTRGRGLLIEEYTEIANQLVTDDERDYAHKAFNLLLDVLRRSAHA
jgi:transcription termination factor NusB